MQYSIEGFWASEKPEVCEEYLQGHVRVLEEFGITNVTTNGDYWTYRDDVFVFICREIETGIVVAGIRVEPKIDSQPLPIEAAVLPSEPKIIDVILSSRNHGRVVEICGLWNSRKVFGREISRFLSECAVASLSELQVAHAYCLVAHYTLDLSKSLGFHVVQEIGTDGWIPYPNETYKAYSMVINDVRNLEGGDHDVIERIMNLRKNTSGISVIKTPRFISELNYNLF
jgi:hypothetical protein